MGGARNRSGPQADPGSLRSAKLGASLTHLPAEGYAGKIPDFPLPRRTVYYTEWIDKRPVRMLDEPGTEGVAEREAEMWAQVWRYPQAAAWVLEPWRWQIVAMYVRTFVVCESSDATAADKGSLHRFGDQIGMTPAGLKENGWAVARDETAPKRTTRKAAAPRPSTFDRLTAVPDAAGQ